MQSYSLFFGFALFCVLSLGGRVEAIPREVRAVQQLTNEIQAADIVKRQSDWNLEEQRRRQVAKSLQIEVKAIGNREKGIWVTIGCLIPVSRNLC